MLSRQLAYKAKKRARKLGIDFSEYLTSLLRKDVEHMPLSSADYQMIAEATKRAEQTRKRISTPLADQ